MNVVSRLSSEPRNTFRGSILTIVSDDRVEGDMTSSIDVQFSWAGDSVVGKVRRVNEDCFAGREGVFVVADGMGGHEAGDVARRIVVDHFLTAITETPIAFGGLERVVSSANADVRGQAAESGRIGMGATLVAVVLVIHHDDPYLAVINVGDSRCYLSDGHGFRCVTHDHSVVQELVDSGQISPEQAHTHPDRNIVTRAMGVDSDVIADYVLLPAVGRQRLLLCSDGVSSYLTAAEVEGELTRPNTPTEAVQGVLDAVMSGAALDNATAVVVDVVWAHDPNYSINDLAEITNPRAMRSTDQTIGQRADTTTFDENSRNVVPEPPRRPLITTVPRSADPTRRRQV